LIYVPYGGVKVEDLNILIETTDISDVFHHLRLKAQNDSENGSASVFRWKGKRENLLWRAL
jgi:hypothetical protein